MSNLRATSLKEMKERSHGFISEEGTRLAMAFQPRPSDIFISPFSKCGTTLLQHIVHGLRSRGDMSFREISDVVPWLIAAHDLGVDLEAQQPFPRAFKSHKSWYDIPKGARYIVSFRDPKDALISRYRHLEGWFFEPDSISISDFARDYYGNPEPHGFWRHLRSWWDRREDQAVLLLCFEDMIQDISRTVGTVAKHCRIKSDPRLLEIVERQSSLDFMKAHITHFDDGPLRERSEKVFGFPSGSDSLKVRVGKPGAHRHELPAHVGKEMDDIWREQIEETIGFSTYEDLRHAVSALTQQTGG